MRRVVLIAGIGAVAFIGVIAVYLASMDVNRFRPQIQSTLEKQLGRPGRFRWA